MADYDVGCDEYEPPAEPTPITGGITETIKAELLRPHPRFVRVGMLIKNFYNADTRISLDISSRVVSWGKLLLSSSLAAVDMEKPGVSVQIKNDDNYLNKYHASSWWKVSPVVDPKECVYVFSLYVLTGTAATRELALKYTGRVVDAEIVHDRTDNYVELVTVAENTVGMTKRLQKIHGGILERPHGTY